MACEAQLPLTLFLPTHPFGLAGPSGFAGDPGEEGSEGLSYGGDPGRVICLNILHPVTHDAMIGSAECANDPFWPVKNKMTIN